MNKQNNERVFTVFDMYNAEESGILKVNNERVGIRRFFYHGNVSFDVVGYIYSVTMKYTFEIDASYSSCKFMPDFVFYTKALAVFPKPFEYKFAFFHDS